MEFRIPRRRNKAKSRITAPDSRRPEFGPFRDQLKRVSLNVALERRGIQERWSTFKDQLLQTQEWSTPTCRKLSKEASRDEQGAPDKKKKTKPKHKKETYQRWK